MTPLERIDRGANRLAGALIASALISEAIKTDEMFTRTLYVFIGIWMLGLFGTFKMGMMEDDDD